MTVISTDSMNNDELIEYSIDNHIDLIISINQKTASLNENLKKIKLLSYNEKKLASSGSSQSKVKEMVRKSIDFKLKSSDLDAGQSDNFEYSLTHAVIDNLAFKPVMDQSKTEYSKENIEVLTNLILNIFSDENIYHERIVLLCK